MKFVIGEVAKLIDGAPNAPKMGLIGTECTITAIGPLKATWTDGKPWYCDYYIRAHKNGIIYSVYEKWLEKKIDPSDYEIAPATLALFTKKQPNPDKVKETERG